MARPKKPIISKRNTLELALRICDEEGLDALSIRRLGREFDVQGVSFYHHFKNKNEILKGVCELALSKVRTPQGTELDWREWLVQNFIAYRKALMAHPNLLPLLMKRQSLRIGFAELNATAGLLAVQGVPVNAVMPLLETLEKLALSSVIDEWTGQDDKESSAWTEEYPSLFHLGKFANIDHNQIFEKLAHAAVNIVIEQASTKESK